MKKRARGAKENEKRKTESGGKSRWEARKKGNKEKGEKYG